MARPIKKGLEYYPQDSDMFNDRNIKRLINEFGSKGFIIYEYIKSLCYKQNGYWVKFDENFCFDLSDSLRAGINEELAMEVLLGCMRIGLFEKKVFDASNIITSSGIQEIYLYAKRTPVIIPGIWVIANETNVNVPETTVIDVKSTQIKVKESKGNNNNRGDDFLGSQIIKGFHSLDLLKDKVLKDQLFIENFFRIGIVPDKLPAWLNAFHRWLLFTGEELKQEREYRTHFRNWIGHIPGYTTMNPDEYQPVNPTPEAAIPGMTETERKLAERYK